MAYTGQQICDRVREQSNDDLKREYPDAEILNLVNDCAKVIYDKRPDFFVGALSAAPADILLGNPWPLEDRTLPWVIDYCVAMLQRPDEEDTAAGVGAAAMAKFVNALKG